jgi:hypothetical protein
VRHFLPAGPVAGLAGRVPKSAGATVLIQTAGPLECDPARVTRAGPRTVALPAVADAAQEEELLAVRPDTDDQPQRIHALPRSGRGGWTSTRRCAKKGAATRALPRCDAARGSGVARLRTLTPQRRRRERFTSIHHSRQPARRQPVVNSALFGDRQQWTHPPARGLSRRHARPRFHLPSERGRSAARSAS